MRQCSQHTGPVFDGRQTKPFAGLGHCLERVRLAALCMRVRRGELSHELCVPCRLVEPVARLSGYGLLVALGREIRGR